MQVSQREPKERPDGSEITVMSYELNWEEEH